MRRTRSPTTTALSTVSNSTMTPTLILGTKVQPLQTSKVTTQKTVETKEKRHMDLLQDYSRSEIKKLQIRSTSGSTIAMASRQT